MHLPFIVCVQVHRPRLHTVLLKVQIAVIKHYLGGRKQLDSLESRLIQTSSNKNRMGV